MRKYLIITFGCQMNKSDSERIASVLENCGHQPASNETEADLILVNMCSVRQSAVDRVFGQRQKFVKLKTLNPKLKTILTGCILREDRKKFTRGFDLILDIKDLPTWPQIVQKATNILIKPWQNYYVNYLETQPKYQSFFTAYVPIMTGCNNFCSFCAVPYTRGKEISRPAEEIICEVKNLVKRGYKEIWLLGQNVNSYGVQRGTNTKQNAKLTRNKRKINFAELLKMINAIPGDFWIRFTSSHPKDFSDELIEAIVNCQKVTEYLNLPVQSGDDEILRKMNRPYIISDYKNLVKKIREKIPEITLSTDVIVGFPGETRKQFENTIKLFKEIKFDMAYIAQYSPRPGTMAAKMKDNIPSREKERRWKILTEILKKTALEKNEKYIGEAVELLPEESKNEYLIGKTRTYKTVKFKGPKDLIGQFLKVEILKALPWGLKGNLLH